MMGVVVAILLAVVLISQLGGDFGKSNSDAGGLPANATERMTEAK